MIREFWQRLQPREQVVLVLGGVATVGILLYAYVLDPALERYRDLDRLIRIKAQQLERVRALQAEYQALSQAYQRLEQQATRAQKGFSPLSFMESLSARAGIQDRVLSMKPRFFPLEKGFREATVEIRAERLTLKEILTYLRLIEDSGKPIRIKTLQIKKRFDEPSRADLTLVVASTERVQ